MLFTYIGIAALVLIIADLIHITLRWLCIWIGYRFLTDKVIEKANASKCDDGGVNYPLTKENIKEFYIPYLRHEYVKQVIIDFAMLIAASAILCL